MLCDYTTWLSKLENELLGFVGDCKGLVWGFIDYVEHTNRRLSLISLASQMTTSSIKD